MAQGRTGGGGSLMDIAKAFARTYCVARVKFLEAAASAGLRIASHVHPAKGRDGEVLAMDVALAGNPDAASLLIVSSGCHGVEGYCGSGVQVVALHDAEWQQACARDDLAVLYIHALNPYGFSHIRRVTHENVDLNRNFCDFTQPLPVNQAYREIHPTLLPECWPPDEDNMAALARYVHEHGPARLQSAVTQGQYAFPEGLFYGGSAPTWSNLTLRKVLHAHGRKARQIGWIDLHTGLGATGVGERIFACRNDAAALVRARRWWSGDGRTPITSIYDGSSVSASLTGLMCNSMYEECPQAEYTGIAMEYGTLAIQQMLTALRAEQWLQLHPEADADQARAIKQQLMDAFYVDTDLWRGQVITQARQALFQALAGLRPSTAG
jgi:hypothetical protein